MTGHIYLGTFVPRNQACYGLIICILQFFSEPVSLCHGAVSVDRTQLMGPFLQSFLSIVCLDQDMYLGRYDLSWPYDVHLVTLMVWSKMAEYWHVGHTEHMVPLLQPFLSTVCLDMDICTHKPGLLWLNNMYSAILSEPVSLCHGAVSVVRPSVVCRP